MSRFLSVALLVVLMLVVAGPVAAQPKPITWDFILNVGFTHPVAITEKEFVDAPARGRGPRTWPTAAPR